MAKIAEMVEMVAWAAKAVRGVGSARATKVGMSVIEGG